MKKPSFIFVFILITSLLFSACSPKSTAVSATPMAASPSGVISEGRLEPVNYLDISFSIPGQVAEVLVKDGDAVENGQVIARLNANPEANSAFQRAKQEALSAQQALDTLQTNAELALAQANLNVITTEEQVDKDQTRYDNNKTDKNKALLDESNAQLALALDTKDKLTNNGGIDPVALAAAQARLETAQAALASAQAALDALELKAPIAGTVVDLTLQPGQRIIAGQTVLVLSDFSSWVVKTNNLTESQVIQITIGQKVNVVLDALPDQTLGGTVEHINTRYEEKRGDITYTVSVLLDQTTPQMRWGMTAAVTFEP